MNSNSGHYFLKAMCWVASSPDICGGQTCQTWHDYVISVVMQYAVDPANRTATGRWRHAAAIGWSWPGPGTTWSALDSFTDPFSTAAIGSAGSLPVVRTVKSDYQWHLKKRWKFLPITLHYDTKQSETIFRPTNQKRVMPVIWRPCLTPGSHIPLTVFGHQARTV